VATDRPAPHPRVARGARPRFFEDPSSDSLLSMNVALLTELMATRERLDTLERVLVARGLLDLAALESFVPDAAAEGEREALRTTMTNHVFYLLLQDAERAAQAPVAGEGDAGATAGENRE
jgi:hypothetical protein